MGCLYFFVFIGNRINNGHGERIKKEVDGYGLLLVFQDFQISIGTKNYWTVLFSRIMFGTFFRYWIFKNVYRSTSDAKVTGCTILYNGITAQSFS